MILENFYKNNYKIFNIYMKLTFELEKFKSILLRYQLKI